MNQTDSIRPDFWWSNDRSEKFWIEVLNTEYYGDRLFAPDSSAYRSMRSVQVGDIVFRWHSERHPDARAGHSGIYAVSRVIGHARPSTDRWKGKLSLEAPLTPKVFLRRPVLLTDLKLRQDELQQNLTKLQSRIAPLAAHSLWQFAPSGLKPVTRYLTKVSAADVDLIVSDHPHVTMAIDRA